MRDNLDKLRRLRSVLGWAEAMWITGFMMAGMSLVYHLFIPILPVVYTGVTFGLLAGISALVGVSVKHRIKDLNKQEQWRVNLHKQERKDDESR